MWEFRSVTDVASDVIVFQQLDAWAWALVVSGACATAFGVVILVISRSTPRSRGRYRSD
jgi:sugar phosphate permease